MYPERRKYFRHPIEIPVQVKHVHRVPVQSFSSRNYSEGGLQFISRELIQTGEALELKFPIKDQLCCLRGRVCFCMRDSQRNSFRIGVEFLDANTAFRAKIAEEILAIQRYREKLSHELNRTVSEEEASELWVREMAKKFADLYQMQ